MDALVSVEPVDAAEAAAADAAAAVEPLDCEAVPLSSF